MFLLTSRPFILTVIVVVSIIHGYYFNQKYKKILAYFREHHPEVIAYIKPERDTSFLRKKVNPYQSSIDFAADHDSLNDPVAETMLKEYGQIYSLSKWIFTILIVWFLFACN